MKKFKKPLIITGIVMASILALAVIIGVLNALLADGKWNFGWTNYDYDDTGYRIGDGTLFDSARVTAIDIDWIDGMVEVVACEDDFISLTEEAPAELTEDSRLRWHISKDGKTLTVKYRKPSWFFGESENKHKKLTVRIPKHLFEGFSSISVTSVSSAIAVSDIKTSSLKLRVDAGVTVVENCTVRNLSFLSSSGKLTFDGTVTGSAVCESRTGELQLTSAVTPEKIKLQGESAPVTLTLPRDAAFRLSFTGDGDNRPTIDFAHRKENGRYVVGSSAKRAELDIATGRGRVLITY